ncbi:alcohol dehydrogenase catalytic domain-containing protein [Secundilactobacillus collinoides]|uniref:alcohol dehydrogenase catalytic domain-containing protein n=1 Tax=Secundilactobacillus collinoides TaxID=33960 RepID=UPI0034E1EB5F
MVASGICHSDEALRIGDAVIDYPIVLGHEGSGIVEKVGPEVTQVKPGDNVVLSFYACGNCKSCLSGVPTSVKTTLPTTFQVCGQMAQLTLLKTVRRLLICLTKVHSRQLQLFVNGTLLKLTRPLIYGNSARWVVVTSLVLGLC